MSRRVTLLVTFTLGLLAGSSALAQSILPGAVSGGKHAKVTGDLLALRDEHRAFLAGVPGFASATGAFRPTHRLVRVTDERVVIDAVAADDATALRADLEALGLQAGATFGRVVSGRLPVAAIDAAMALSTLRFIRPAYAMTRTGAVDSQGDLAMRADIARSTSGLNGDGVLVGTLSDSFDCLGGAAGDVATGDLPAGIVVLEEEIDCISGSDEGRAIMQIIHDVAPGTTQAFHSAFNGMASFAQGIIDLADIGANVIVDDVIYFAEPMFQDGIVAQAVDQVTAAGVAYFSAAGNDARDAYESGFVPGSAFGDGAFPSVPGAPLFFAGTAHDFDPGPGVDHFQQITLPANATVFFTLQWDQPFFSVSGAPGSANDYDIYLFNNPPTTVLAGAATDNGGLDPVEVFGFTNPTGVPVAVNLMLVKFGGGPNAGRLKYVKFGSNITIHQFATNSSTLYGHTNAAGSVAVGAAFFLETPAFGTTPPVLEPFSSAGGTPILFLTNGMPTNQARNKPEIVAPDGGDTTFFGTDVAPPNGRPNFFGTSASAPHAAGVAALLRQLRPLASPALIRSALQASAIDMGPAGFDFDSGAGLIQADAALAFLAAVGGGGIVTGAGPGGGPDVRAFDGLTLAGVANFFAYHPAFTGGVRVAAGDVNNDEVPDIISGAGPGGGPHVQVFSGLTAALLRSFFAYDPLFTGGVFVAAGDVTGDGRADIVTGAGPGGGPHVRVFDGVTGAEVRSFFAYQCDPAPGPCFTGGVSVAAGDVTGDGRADIVTGAGPGGGPHVRVFDGVTGAEVRSFFAYQCDPAPGPCFTGGVFVAAGDVNDDGTADIITGAGPGGGPHVKVFDGVTGAEIRSFFAYAPAFTGGVAVASGDVDQDGVPDIITGAGPGGGPHVQVFSGKTGALLRSFFAYAPTFTGGVFVAGHQ